MTFLWMHFLALMCKSIVRPIKDRTTLRVSLFRKKDEEDSLKHYQDGVTTHVWTTNGI